MLLEKIKYDLTNVSEKVYEGNSYGNFTTYGDLWKLRSFVKGDLDAEIKFELVSGKFYYSSPYLSFGDYDNSCHIERSNVRVFESDFKDCKDWIKVTGDYGSESIFIDVTTENTEIIEIVEFFLDWQIMIDEEDCTLMEMELIDEAWDCCIKDDVLLFIKEKFNVYSVEILEGKDSDFRNWFEEIREKENRYLEIQSGGNAYVDYRIVLNVFCSMENREAQITVLNGFLEFLTY